MPGELVTDSSGHSLVSREKHFLPAAGREQGRVATRGERGLEAQSRVESEEDGGPCPPARSTRNGPSALFPAPF